MPVSLWPSQQKLVNEPTRGWSLDIVIIITMKFCEISIESKMVSYKRKCLSIKFANGYPYGAKESQ